MNGVYFLRSLDKYKESENFDEMVDYFSSILQNSIEIKTDDKVKSLDNVVKKMFFIDISENKSNPAYIFSLITEDNKLSLYSNYATKNENVFLGSYIDNKFKFEKLNFRHNNLLDIEKDFKGNFYDFVKKSKVNAFYVSFKKIDNENYGISIKN